MKILKIFMYVLIAISIGLASAYYYYFYAPASKKPVLSGDYHQRSLKVDGRERTFSYYVPENADQSSPLILVLHGSRSTGSAIRQATAYEFDQLADERGHVVVYPNGYLNHWNDCRKSAEYKANTENVDDIAFLAAIVEFFSIDQEVTSDRVFIVGHSNGGHMAYRLALEVPQMMGAVAAISANLPADKSLGCQKSGQPVSIALFNGTLDPINPYNGGPVVLFGNSSRGSVLSTDATIAYWKTLAQIDTEPVRETLWQDDGGSETSVREIHWRAKAGTSIALYTSQGAGHAIPTKTAQAPRFYGPQSRAISAPLSIVNFFASTTPGRTNTAD